MESIIAYHCAPALAGIKPSNIVSCYKNQIKDIFGEISRLNSQLNSKDIFLEPLCECDKRVLLMAYRKKVLEKTLGDADIKEFLTSCGYPDGGEAEDYISFLKKQFKGKEFPHEIGAFLGYPLHDIYGFMHHKDEGCILCGEWKVYKNAEEAARLFRRFAACRKAVVQRLLCGQTLSQVFV